MLGKTTAPALTKARQIGSGLYGKSKENLLNLLVIVKFRKRETNFLSPRGRGQVPSPRGGCPKSQTFLSENRESASGLVRGYGIFQSREDFSDSLGEGFRERVT